jgi:hypothetical protein
MNRYLIFAIASILFAPTSLAHESDTITPTGFKCELEYESGKIIGYGDCVKGDRFIPNRGRDVSSYDYCNLNSIKQSLRTDRKGQIVLGAVWCLYSPKIKKRNADS